jgi:hypothetical protein
MVIRLTSDIETALAREAQRRGTTPERLALDSLEKLFLQTPPDAASGEESLVDFVSGYIGAIEGTERHYPKTAAVALLRVNCNEN